MHLINAVWRLFVYALSYIYKYLCLEDPVITPYEVKEDLYCYELLYYKKIVECIWRRKLKDDIRFTDSTKNSILDQSYYSDCYPVQRIFTAKPFDDCVFVRLISFNIKQEETRYCGIDHCYLRLALCCFCEDKINPYTTVLILRKSMFEKLLKKYEPSFDSYLDYITFVLLNDAGFYKLKDVFIGLLKQVKSNTQPEEMFMIEGDRKNIVECYDCTHIVSI